MAEERKTDEALEKAVETDEDIDRYIRELTGKETPKDKEKKAEEKKAPEKEEFRVTSQIGEDDYKAFIYYSTLGRFKWLIPAFIIVPLVFSFLFAFNAGHFYVGNFILSLLIMYVAITLIVVIRCTRWLSKIRNNNPAVMHLTETTLIFMTNSIINMKNGNRIKVDYKHMIDVGESRQHYIMYFDNGKSMVFRKEEKETLEKFRPFIESKVHKLKFTQMLKK